MTHRFRFFVSASDLTPGIVVPLHSRDVQHLRVVRLGDGDTVEVVDADQRVWQALITADGASVRIIAGAVEDDDGDTRAARPCIELLAGVIAGGRFDQLVDAAVQAGGDRIVPVAKTRAEATRIDARRDRLQRVSLAAAKQSKRRVIPTLCDAVLVSDAETWRVPGIVLDANARMPLLGVLDDLAVSARTATVRVYVGSADGIDARHIDALVEGGWRAARLGTPIARSELAAALTIAMVRASIDAARGGSKR